MNDIDIVLPFIHSRFKNLELRYALRSIERYAVGYRRIYLVGDNPGFLKDCAFHVPCPAYCHCPKDAKIALQLLWLFDRAPVTSPCCLWNDDFILTQDVDCRRIRPYRKNFTLIEAAAKHKSRNYSATLRATGEALLSGGFPAWHYDIHLPIHYVPNQFCNLWDWWTKSARSAAGYVVKSVYQNVYGDHERDPFIEDCKINKFPGPEALQSAIAGRWCYSYSDATVKTGLLDHLETVYPEKSRYEQ